MKKNSLYLSLLLTFVLGMTACGSDNSTNASVENPVLGTNSSSSGSGASNKNDSRIGSFYNPAITYGQLVDARDGNVYRTVQIGSQVWMAENLKYNNNPSSPWVYPDMEARYALYGRTYIPEEALTACPMGWHLPSIDEWKNLYSVVGENPYALVAKDWNIVGWKRGTDDYGMSIFPCIQCYYQDVVGTAYTAVYWSSTNENSFPEEEAAFHAYKKPLLHYFQIYCFPGDLAVPDSDGLIVHTDLPTMMIEIPLSVRCVKD